MQGSRKKSVPLQMMELKLSCVLGVLPPLFLRSVLASKESSGGSDSVTVSILVCLLILLLILLFLAWRRLSHESEGRYHPRSLMRGLYRRWREFRGEARTEELSQGYQDQRDEELGEEHDDDDGEEEEQQQLQQEDKQQEEEEEEEEKETILNENINAESLEKAVLLEPSKEDGASRATGSSAEALLSDLHSFSGTAAWEDSGKHLHVTAL